MSGRVDRSRVVPQLLGPSELAAVTGVSTDTLRHYERKGVLSPPARGRNGYRRYPTHAVSQVRLVRRALAIGFTLDELSRVMAERDRGGAPCHKVRALVATRLADLEARLRDLAALRDELHLLLREWDARLAQVSGGGQARLLDTLAGRPAIERATTTRGAPRRTRA